jgi:hypothetical protein
MADPRKDFPTPGETLAQHALAPQQLGAVTHMCPECGINVRPFCRTCYGIGSVTTEDLDRWQARVWAEAS